MYSVRPFKPVESEYEACVALSNAANPDAPPATVEQWKAICDEWESGYHYQRFVVEKGSANETTVIVAVGAIFEVYWAYNPGDYTFWFNLQPDLAGRDVARLIYEPMVTSLDNRTPALTRLVTVTRENKTGRIQFLLDLGFRQVERHSKSALY